MKAFVYGSLKKGHWNNSVLGDSEFLGRGTARGYDLVDLGSFPAVYRASYNGDKKLVSGELYQIDEGTLERLDWLEGNGSFYQRELTTIEIDEEEHEAYIYEFLEPDRGTKRNIVEVEDREGTMHQRWAG